VIITAGSCTCCGCFWVLTGAALHNTELTSTGLPLLLQLLLLLLLLLLRCAKALPLLL
jgi:hypothetical protein